MKNRIFKFIPLAVLWMFGLPLSAQEYTKYEWDDDRKMIELNEEEKAHNLYYIQKKEIQEWINDGEKSIGYITNHDIVKVNNEDALEKSNQIYIPLWNTIDVVDLKARVITPDGRVIDFDQNNIKKLENDDSGYQIFAVEGAEVGSEIEYYYTRKTYVQNFISRFIQQTSPIKNYSFKLTCEDAITFDFKVYNDTAGVHQTDTSSSVNVYEMALNNVPELHSEPYSAYDNERIRLEAKIAYNSDQSISRLFTWGTAGQRVYYSLKYMTKAESKAFAKFLKQLAITPTSNFDDFLRAEHYIKTNIGIEPNAGDAGENLSSIIKNRYASEKGATKLYIQLLEYLNIPYEIVLTCSRFDRAFDGGFDSWNYLDDYLIYLPKQQQFVSPKDVAFRTGTIPSDFQTSDALFIRKEPIQDFVHPVAYIREIPEVPYYENMDNLTIDVSFNEDLSKNIVKMQREMLGFSADYTKMASLFMDETQMEEMKEELVKYLSSNAEIISNEITQNDTEPTKWQEPFAIDAQFETEDYIETAGDIILFHAGKLIGPQSEMYQEEERHLQIVNDYNRGYNRKITIDLPEGYEVKNPEDIIIEKSVENNFEEILYFFGSKYRLENNQIIIDISEYYNLLNYPREGFEDFKSVINAAADWNKIVLVLEPK